MNIRIAAPSCCDPAYPMKIHPLQCAALLAAFVSSAASSSASSQLTVIADGLNSPRGLAFGANGHLYVAEAGVGAGDGHGGVGVGVGFTGAIIEISGVHSSQPTAKRIITNLLSFASPSPGDLTAFGVQDVSIHGNGSIQAVITSSVPELSLDFPDASLKALAQVGRVIKATPSGQWKTAADVGSFNYQWTVEHQNAPWAAFEFPNSFPYGVATAAGRTYVVDTAANTVGEVSADGSVRVIAFVPNPMFPLPGEAEEFPMGDAEPTCVTVGPDGFLYVGTYAILANFYRIAPFAPPEWQALPPQSKIYRVNPSDSNKILTDDDVWAAGLNPIVGCKFGAGALYLTEAATPVKTEDDAYLSGLGDVVRIATTSDGSAGARKTLGSDALLLPYGIAVGDDEAVYVSNFSYQAGVAQVVRVNW